MTIMNSSADALVDTRVQARMNPQLSAGGGSVFERLVCTHIPMSHSKMIAIMIAQTASFANETPFKKSCRRLDPEN